MGAELHAVTGAFGYTGKYIALRLLAAGKKVITLTNSLQRDNPFGGRVGAFPFDFDRPECLERHLQGVEVLYNTYWIRFNHRLFTQADAVRNTKILFEAAKRAGVRRVVHISIANPSIDSPLDYYRGKAELEAALQASGLSYAILRPTVLFGKEDILINNIAWSLRHLPVFGTFGLGAYRIQPIYVDDFAALAVEQGQANANVVIDAAGPETFAYRDLVKTIGRLIGCWRPVVPVPPVLGHLAAWAIGAMVGDVVITRAEVEGLMAGLLCIESTPTGTTRLSDWIQEHRDSLGRRYASELARRIDRTLPYRSN